MCVPVRTTRLVSPVFAWRNTACISWSPTYPLGLQEISRVGTPRRFAATRSCGFSSSDAKQISAPRRSAAASASSDIRFSRTPSSSICVIGQASSRSETRPMVAGNSVTARAAFAPSVGSALPRDLEKTPVTVGLARARQSRWYQRPVVQIRVPAARISIGSSSSSTRNRRWSSNKISPGFKRDQVPRRPPAGKAGHNRRLRRWRRAAMPAGLLCRRER